MEDIEKARQLLAEGFTCVLCKGDILYTSRLRGVAPMMEWLGEGVQMGGFSAADKVVGKAVAMLFALAGVEEVHGDIMSKAAAQFLTMSGIRFSYGTLADSIINRSGDGICPMEQLTSHISEPAEAFETIKQKLIELRKE